MKTATLKTAAAASMIVMFTLSCAGTSWQEKEKTIIGGTGGAVAGGLIAHALDAGTAGVLGGIILGGLIGGAIGDRLDAADQREANQATYRALESTPSGGSINWQNPDSGVSGRVTPLRTYQAANGQYCREYRQDVMIDNETRQVYRNACRRPDGSWQAVN
jgi:surface antigen